MLIQNLTIWCYPPKEGGEIFEKFLLQFALKLLFSESLEKRINGLSEINTLIEMINLKGKEQKQNEQGPPPARWMSFKYMIDLYL